MGTRAGEQIWTTEGARKRAAVQDMFGEIAPSYDRLNGMMSLSLHRRWRAYAVSLLNLHLGDRALDVCCGTGDFLAPLRRAVGETGLVIGVDFSLPMLERAAQKIGISSRLNFPSPRFAGSPTPFAGEGDLDFAAVETLPAECGLANSTNGVGDVSNFPSPRFASSPTPFAGEGDLDFAASETQATDCCSSGLSMGDACQLPIASSIVDAVTVGWGIRNVPDIDLAHREVVRVLRPGGRFVSLDMARPKNRIVRFVSEFIFNTVVPKMGALFGKTDAYTYLPKSTQRFWTREQLAASMTSAGLVDVRYRDLMFGNICIHFGRKSDAEKSGSPTGENRA